MIIAATGHRPEKLGGYSPEAFDRLYRLACWYLMARQPSAVISGLALGWDQAWAKAAIELGIPCHGAVPFEGQQSRWPEESQARYWALRNQCASVTIVCDAGYSARAMQLRNIWMVGHCNLVCALWDGTAGGTANCVKYAQKVGRAVENIYSSLLQYP